MTFDQSLFTFIHSFAHRLGFLDGVGIFFGRIFPWVLIIVFLLKLFFEKHWRMRLYAFSVATLSILLARGIIVEVIHFFYYRPRPPLVFAIDALIPTPASSAFPSSHATIFFALAMSLFFISKRWGYWFLGGATLISIARIFTGVHWPFDVLIGAVIGIGSAYIIKKLLPAKERYREYDLP